MANNSQVPITLITNRERLIRAPARTIVINGFCYDDGTGRFDISRVPGTGIDDYVRRFQVLISLRRNRQDKEVLVSYGVVAPDPAPGYFYCRDAE